MQNTSLSRRLKRTQVHLNSKLSVERHDMDNRFIKSLYQSNSPASSTPYRLNSRNLHQNNQSWQSRAKAQRARLTTPLSPISSVQIRIKQEQQMHQHMNNLENKNRALFKGSQQNYEQQMMKRANNHARYPKANQLNQSHDVNSDLQSFFGQYQ